MLDTISNFLSANLAEEMIKKQYDELIKLNVEVEEKNKTEIVKDALKEKLFNFKNAFQKKQRGFDINGLSKSNTNRIWK